MNTQNNFYLKNKSLIVKLNSENVFVVENAYVIKV